MTEPISVTATNFRDLTQSETPIIIDCWADWCGPCKRFAPVFDSVAEKTDGVVFGKIDTQHNQELATVLDIQSIPTLLVFCEGILLHRSSGALTSTQLQQLVDAVKGVDMDAVRAEIAKQEAKPDKTMRF